MRIEAERVRYPRQFEIFRLEALGDVPYLEPDEARARYEEGKGLSVVSEGQPPAWFMQVSVNRYRFSLTFYVASGTPVREVTWEQEGAELFCRRTIDLFYPDGDPGKRVPFVDLVTVTRQISVDGVVGVTLASPIEDEVFRETTGVQHDDLRLEVLAFGEWQTILAASAPASLNRFGLDSNDDAGALADRYLAEGQSTEHPIGESGAGAGGLQSARARS